MNEPVSFTLEDGLAIITINNLPSNALTKEVVLHLRNTLEQLGSMGKGSANKMVLIITGAGNRVFSAGADINLFLKLRDRKSGEDLSEFYQTLFDLIEQFQWPVLCAVNGLALGGGCEMALACDIRVASENSKFGLTEVKLGVLPAGGGTQRLSRLVGPGRAKELIFTGQIITAEEAWKIGLVEKVAPAGKELDMAIEIARQILSNAPRAVYRAKDAINRGVNTSLKEGLIIERQALGLLAETQDVIEGANAFLAKRKPVFVGR